MIALAALSLIAAMPDHRTPCAYVSHGGGPLPLLGHAGHTKLIADLKTIPKIAGQAPKAIVVISAHWETAHEVRVTTAVQPSLLFDYSGFPPETYRYKYPVAGSPKLAAQIQELLRRSDIPCSGDAKRGLDHGTFVPLMLMWPDLPSAQIPVVQVSMLSGLDAKTHLKMGKALSPLRDKGVLILGSGSSSHNMQGFFRPSQKIRDASREFDRYLHTACSAATEEKRHEALSKWESGSGSGSLRLARMLHPTEEHLMPLLVVAGAAGADSCTRLDHGMLMGSQQLSSWIFGTTSEGESSGDAEEEEGGRCATTDEAPAAL